VPTFIRSAIKLACFSASLLSFSAFGGDGMSITLDNDTTSTLLVTVYDLNADHQKVLESKEINSFASINISISTDQSGHGHVAWTATNTDRDSRRCGHRDKRGLNDGDIIHVRADSPCGRN
jgi:hypothetical protein